MIGERRQETLSEIIRDLVGGYLNKAAQSDRRVYAILYGPEADADDDGVGDHH